MTGGEILRRVKREPLLLLTLALAALELTEGLDWRAAVIVIGGLIARQFTTPAHDPAPVDEPPEGGEQ